MRIDMAEERVVCKYCNSPNVVKDGFVEGTQKYLLYER
jgi:transposase-like protein